MKFGKYDRNVTLHCPTCGGTQFEFDHDINDANMSIRCISCNCEMTKEDLIRENSENIDEHVSEMGDELHDEFVKELRKSFKKAFKGSKNIKFK